MQFINKKEKKKSFFDNRFSKNHGLFDNTEKEYTQYCVVLRCETMEPSLFSFVL